MERPLAKKKGSKLVLVVAIAMNVAIAATKLVVAGVSGSAAMLAEAIHSLVDTGDGVLLMVGSRRSRRGPDEEHPFGYGQELYFWALVVAMLIFTVGGLASAGEGIYHLVEQHVPTHVGWSLGVIGLSAVFEAVSWLTSYREVRRLAGKGTVWRTIRDGKDPTAWTVLLEDSAALLGLLAAFAGVSVGALIRSPVPDALASIAVGVILAAVAFVLARETRSLLLGESIPKDVRKDVRRLVEEDPAIERVNGVRTMHFGPEDVLLNLDVVFRPDLAAEDVARATVRVEDAIRAAHPRMRRIYLESAPEEGRPR